MMLNFASFTDELCLIKEAEIEAPKKKPKLDKKKLFKQLFINAAAYGGGFGLGSGAAYVAAEKLLPKYLPGLSSAKRWGVSGVGGALLGLGTLATWEAMRLARKGEDERASK